MRHTTLLFLLVSATGSIGVNSALAQSPEPATTRFAHRLSGPIILDGFSDEPAWQGIEPLPITVYEPTYGSDPSERTEFRIAYDDEFFYISARMYASDPSQIRVNTLTRDTWSGDDTFGVIIDAFNDDETAAWFLLTPGGVRTDASISNDGQGFPNFSWNNFWDGAAKTTDQGWFGEIRVPFSTLGFQTIDDRTVMGITLYRWIGWNNERHVFPDQSPEWPFNRPSHAQDVVLEGVRARQPIYFTPYALGGLQRTSELNAPGTAFGFADDRTTEAGGDLRYNVTDNLRLDLSLNTDFAQVEADDEQVNLTRFSLFFPEKRQFFQERAAIFDFSLGFRDRLFHSRRIGLNAGEPVRILGGARMVGRIGGWDIGVLNMQTARRDSSGPENFGVVRVRKEVFNTSSFLGGMMTSRAGENGVYNLAYGVDGLIRVFGDDYLTFRAAQTSEDDAPNASSLADANSMLLRWERRRNSGLAYAAQFRRAGADFNPELGFVTRRDFFEVGARTQYDHFFGEGTPLRRFRPFQIRAVFDYRNSDRSLESSLLQHQAQLQWNSGLRLQSDVSIREENLSGQLDFPEGTFVPAGSYTFVDGRISINMPRSSLLRTEVSARIGSFYDGSRYNFSVSPTWTVSRFLELGAQYDANLVRFSDRNQRFNSHIARVRIRAAFNNTLSVNTLVQYSSTSDLVSANVRIRLNVREGNDLFVVFNEGVNTDLDSSVPRLTRTNSRTVLVKYTYTFTW